MTVSLRLPVAVVVSMAALVTLVGTLAVAQTEKVLYTFPGAGPDEGNPYAGPILDNKGNLYGTAVNGGAYNHGAVFELSPGTNGEWTESTLHSFNTDGQDGVLPYSSLVMDPSGNLYGTTYSGGAYGSYGTVFELHRNADGSWTESILHSFNADGTDGYNPYANLIFDKLGNLYGTTYAGGTLEGAGTVFELSPQEDGTWLEQIIHSFDYTTDGAGPYDGLVFDAAGRLYGTTYGGGVYQHGAVFAMERGSNGAWTESVICSFQAGPFGYSLYGGLAIDKAGHLYGTTNYGGNNDGSGTVFELAKVLGTWQETVIHNFGPGDGLYPYSPLAIDASGNLYGTTFQSVVNNVGGAGIVFELSKTKPNVWEETILHNFVNPGDGGNPYSGVALDGAGHIYGTSWFGGVGNGVVFEVTLPTATTTTITPSPNPSTYWQAVTFTSVVTSKIGAPPDGETVSFLENLTVLGNGTLSGGSASFTTSALSAATNSIKAVYGGDSQFAASASNILKQVVGKATTTTTLTSSRNPSPVGAAVTFSASVTPQFGGTVKGTVTFYDGTTALKTVGVRGGVAKFTTSTLTSGAHMITAKYNGGTDLIGSSASLTQTVN